MALWDHRSEHVWGFEIVRARRRRRTSEAGIGPEDVDVLEVHDAFTIGEIVTVEALGLAAREGGAAARRAPASSRSAGRSRSTRPAVCSSRGHPLGATGLAQLAEVIWQLRGEAGARQVDSARTALVETMGGGASGLDGNGVRGRVLGG